MGFQKNLGLVTGSAILGASAASVFWIMQFNRSDTIHDNYPARQSETQQPQKQAPEAKSPLGEVVAQPPAITGMLEVPVAGVDRSALTDTYTQSRDGRGRLHNAIDIMAPAGTPVVATAAGTVEKLFVSDRGGNTIYVRSANRRRIYYYAHLDSYAPDIREGDKVTADQLLGSVGSSGNADPSGPHLHFEILDVEPDDSWTGGRPVNPYPLLAGGANQRGRN